MKLDATTIETLRPWFPTLAVDNVRVLQGGPVSWFVRVILRQGAMTIDPFVFYGRSRLNPSSPSSLALLAHELKHVEQYRRFGRLGFLLRYLRDLARNRFRYARDLPLEAECYALQAEVREALQEAPSAGGRSGEHEG
jgi:hypothetical protein